MTQIVKTVHVACPPERVFAVLSNVERLPEFSRMTVDVRNGPGRPVQRGDRFDQVVRILGVELETEWEVTDVQPDARLQVEGRSPGNGRATLTEQLERDGDGTRVTLEVDYDLPLGVLGDIADKLVVERKNEEEADHILESLRELCERTDG